MASLGANRNTNICTDEVLYWSNSFIASAQMRGSQRFYLDQAPAAAAMVLGLCLLGADQDQGRATSGHRALGHIDTTRMAEDRASSSLGCYLRAEVCLLC